MVLYNRTRYLIIEAVSMKRIWLICSLFLLSLSLISCSSGGVLNVPKNTEVDRIVAVPSADGNPDLTVVFVMRTRL